MQELLELASSYLYLSSRISNKSGRYINEGERFSVRFSLTNTAPAATQLGAPRFKFLSPYLLVQQTRYAAPLSSSGNPVSLVGNNFTSHLEPGETTSTEVDFIALDTADWSVFHRNEEYVKATVEAPIDTTYLFKALRSFTFSTDIVPQSARD
ncbi:hypothetical protein K0504_11170 [Neiella marina]|uniref:Uncharacterized protein n=1 Tax=Neiella holothuriorum TaxID=2870530 RepID=A0ABS7EGX2_9GAMM|nr:hypothetical protein [Neiella holothuriorum]MBW8191599.1 hypothetical protein [Neiella holothuriorum]